MNLLSPGGPCLPLAEVAPLALVEMAVTSHLELLLGEGVRVGRLLLSRASRRGGMSGFKNLLLQRVARPDPSILTKYWSKFFTSIMQPVLSHFLGRVPV